jgi:ferrochelatase
VTIPVKYGRSLHSRFGILMLGFGGPECMEDVRPFIANVTAGRNVPIERLETVVEQYKTIGGRSPFNELTAMQAQALAEELERSGEPIAVYTGMLFWHPHVSEAVAAMKADGVQHALVAIMAPHRTEASFERYMAAAEYAAETSPQLHFFGTWHTDPLFIEAVSDRVLGTLNAIEDVQPQSVQLIFTAHSVPQKMSDLSGYAQQIAETATRVVASIAEIRAAFDWCVGYQSRSGSPQEPWLDPDIAERINEAKTAGKTHVVVVPIGFVCDHVEVLFDLDVLAAKAADAAGIKMLRAGTVGHHSSFIKLLARLAREKTVSYAQPERR